MDFGGNSLKLDYEKSVFVPEILRVRNFVNIMQIREGNEEGMGRGSKKTDYGGFIVLQISRSRETGNTDWLITCQSVNKSIKVGCVYSVSKLSRENVSIENGGLRGGFVAGLQ